MIPQAPTDFWERVVARVAVLVFERESGRPEGQGVVLARAGPPAERRPVSVPPSPLTAVEGGQ